MAQHKDLILILDFGAQYTQLISRKVRELGVYSEIKPFNISIQEIKVVQPKGLILSGGPESVYEKNAPLPDKSIFDLDIPVLGICYGLQVISHFFAGEIAGGTKKREFGLAELKIEQPSGLFKNVAPVSKVWMSHGDALDRLPRGFEILGSTENSPYAAFANKKRNFYCVQFHPEVTHTVEGKKILGNFVY